MKILIDGQTFESPELHRGIGVYVKNVINAMIKQSYGHDWFIAVANDRYLSELDPWVRSRLHILIAQEFLPSSNYICNEAYTNKAQEIIDEYDIDAFWVPNALMVNVLFLNRPLTCNMFATVYDIIPYIFPIQEWPQPIINEYHRRLSFLKNESRVSLFMISQATLNDWQKNIGECNGRCYVTVLAADSKVFFKRREQIQKKDPYILFTGGFDYRKNIDGALEGFKLAREKYIDDGAFQSYRLIIVGKYDESTKEKYLAKIKSKSLTQHVELAGEVSLNKLAQLYQEADLFFFPSKYEGFGLPLLEAMLAGDYVICANNSSLPEVCGEYATYFDADDKTSMADALYRGFCHHRDETLEDIEARQKYAKSFNWETTAVETLNIIDRTINSKSNNSYKPKLAIFTPWPMQKTGIANFEYKLVPYLTKYFEITVFTNSKEKNCKNMEDVCILDIGSFNAHRREYDYKLYQIGNNNAFHKEIFDMFIKESGIAEIHDFVLTPFFYWSYFKANQKKMFLKLLIDGYGEQGKLLYKEMLINDDCPDINEYPMVHAVTANAEKTIFHNSWCSSNITQKNKCVIPLPAFDFKIPQSSLTQQSRANIQQFIDKKKETIVGCFGWVNENKRPDVVVRVIKRLIDEGYAVKLAFWGENNTKRLTKEIHSQHLEESVVISGYLSEEEYYFAMEITDIVVNLRYPSMGEASGTLCEALKLGKAVIVSDLNQYKEFPDDVCWKLPVDELEDKLLYEYLKILVSEPLIRHALGENGREYANTVLNPENIAKMYYHYIVE